MITIILAIALLGLALTIVYQLSRHVTLGFACLLAAEFYREAVGAVSLPIGRVHLDPFDAVCICLMIAGVIRTAPRLRSVHVVRLLAVSYMVLFAFSYARGLQANGLTEAGNDVRGFLAPVLGILYFLSAPTDEKSLRKYTWMYLGFGAALCVIAALGAVGLPVGVAAWGDSNARASDARYLPASGAAAIAICGFLSLALVQYQKRGLISRVLPVLFFAVAIYLRHRTVWMMLLFGAFALFPIDRKLFRRLIPLALVSFVVIAGLAIYGANLGDIANAAQFSDSATNAETWEWRVNSWRELLFDQDQTALTVAVGKSMGSGYWRVDLGTNRGVNVQPHNEYVHEYLRVGAIGALFAFLFTVYPLRKLWRLTKEDPLAFYPSTSAWVAVVVAVTVYGITYDFEAHFFSLIGIANAILMNAIVPEQVTSVEEVEQDEEWNIIPIPSTSD